METEYQKARRVAWFEYKAKHPGEWLSVQSFCAGYDAAQQRLRPTGGDSPAGEVTSSNLADTTPPTSG